MFSYIKGTVREINNNSITVENSFIGYEIYVSNPYFYKLEEEYKVYIYQHVREDINILFGFEDRDYKNLFLRLISVKGIGPKTAIGILANGNLKDIVSAIENCDDKFLAKFPGIGPKASQQIILDLKGKMKFPNSSEIATDLQKQSDLEETLKALGYKDRDIKNVIKDFDFKKNLNALIKEALKNLLR